MKDLDKLALALPETEKELEEGRATYHVGGKYFCFQRRARRDAVDAETGERLTDVLVFRVADQDMKDFVLADSRLQAVERLREAAADAGANAVIAMRFDCNELGGNMTEVAAYGTAVTVRRA